MKTVIFVYDIYGVRLKYNLFYMTDSKFELFKYYGLEQIREDEPWETGSTNGRMQKDIKFCLGKYDNIKRPSQRQDMRSWTGFV